MEEKKTFSDCQLQICQEKNVIAFDWLSNTAFLQSGVLYLAHLLILIGCMVLTNNIQQIGMGLSSKYAYAREALHPISSPVHSVHSEKPFQRARRP